mmetsp:Transcript_24308/g.76564  ORF Transcript_24308/g.76564 Transcript_24308/m.76564 type:complete len:185 (+) Transcript_24308:1270-1824(+)
MAGLPGAVARGVGDVTDAVGQTMDDLSGAAGTVIENAYASMKKGMNIVLVNRELARERAARLHRHVGIISVAATWATFTFFIWVYGVKMYTHVGPGAEREFVFEWTRLLLVDNFLFAWKTAFRNAIITQIVGVIVGSYAVLVDPVKWFETFDDDATLDILEVEGVDMPDFDDMEAMDVIANPFE